MTLIPEFVRRMNKKDDDDEEKKDPTHETIKLAT